MWHAILEAYNCNLSSLQLVHLFLQFTPLIFSYFSYEHWGTNDKHQAMNEPGIFCPVTEKSVTSAWDSSANIDNVAHTCFWVAQEVQKGIRGSERWLKERNVFNKHNCDQHRSGKVGKVWWSSLDCSNARKSAGYEKVKCLEDYHRSFRHIGRQRKIGDKAAEYWSKGAVPCRGVKDVIECLQTEPVLLCRILTGDEIS